jgi:hypothetical protein
MAWWNNYDRNFSNRYDRTYGYGGGHQGGAYGTGGRYTRNDSAWGNRDRSYQGGDSGYSFRNRYDYDTTYRTSPEDSPTYGSRGDEEVRRWARRHGYDEGMEISPRGGQSGGRNSRWDQQGSWGSQGSGRNMSRGWDDSQTQRGGWGRGSQGNRGWQESQRGWEGNRW